MASKKVLRKVFLEKRLFLSEEEYLHRNTLLQSNIAKHIDFKKFQCLHTFLSIASKKEVLTQPIIGQALAQNPNISVLVSKTLPGNQLSHYLYNQDTKIVINNWGIPEPSEAEPISPSKVDLVLVPLITFDRLGHRIGYGKGYYDRFLKTIPNARKVGLSLAPTLDLIPFSDEMDVRLDSCITPFKVYEFDTSG
ncbi:MAG: 5-formyltetrahydrofolate cyclo-ligase [Fulvivirga sp.]